MGWALFALVSVALHAVLLAGARTGGKHWGPDGGDAIVVDIEASSDGARAGRSHLVDEWKALPQWSGASEPPRAVALLPFPGADTGRSSFDEGAYVPLSKLTLRPTPIRGIFVPYPEGADQTTVSSVRLVLFIDEDGAVRQVRVDDSWLPRAFSSAAMKAFESARFHPGRIDDRVVKTRMIVQVEFEGPKRRP